MENPYSFQINEFSQYEKTITAELIGQISHVPPQDYTGVPIGIIIEKASPLPEAARLKVMASDGYIVEFDLQAVLKDDRMLLIKEDDMLRLIAGNYDGGHWVKMVNKIVVE